MKKFIQRVQDLSQKATQLKQVVEAAPAQAAQLRDTVLMTAGQLQQMRHDVQSNLMGLKVDNESRLAQALQEVNDHAEVFQEAGYQLTGVDMELSPTQRLIVHLEKYESASETTIRSLLSAHAGEPTVYALLDALIKADVMSNRVRLSHLHYRGLVIHVGPMPSVRLCWGTEEPAEAAPVSTVAAAAHAPATQPAPPPLPSFGQSSFFEQRPTISPARPSAEPAPVAASSNVPPTTLASPPKEEPSAGGAWSSSALDRFKKMPDVSKYRR